MVLLLVVAAVLCAATFPLSKAALAIAAPFLYVGVRMTLAGGLLCGYMFVRRQSLKVARKDILWFLQVTLFNVYLTFMLELWGMQHITSSGAAFAYNLTPFITGIVSFLILDERLTPRMIIGMVIGFLATLPMVYSECTTCLPEISPVHATSTALGYLAMLGAVAAGAYGWVPFRKLVSELGYSATHINALSMLFGGLMALCTSALVEGVQPLPVSDWRQFIILTASIIVVSNFMFYNLYGYMLKKYTATFLAFAGIMSSVVAALMSWYFLGERLGIEIVIAAIGIGIGLWMYMQKNH